MRFAVPPLAARRVVEDHRRVRIDRAALIVWSFWLGMLVLMVWQWRPVSSPIPLAEDWYTVPLVTGQPVDLPSWLWEQNNEHRMPVARLLLLAALKGSRGDYRAGGLLNMALLAAGAAGLILFARHLRGGVTDLGDAFFPLTLLNFGHSIDVLFPFQITFVLSLAFIMIAGCVLYLPRSAASPRAAAAAGVSLLLLPLSGFIGLVYVPSVAAFVGYIGFQCVRGSGAQRQRPGVGWWLIGASVCSLVLAALYFVGYQHPAWNPPNPGVFPSVKVILKMFALGFGASAFFWWAPAVLAAMPFLTASGWQGLERMMRPGRGRFSAGPLVFFATSILFAAGVGWGRAGYVPEIGIPLRYVSISLPAFISAYLLWTVSTSRWAAAVQRGLAIVMLALLPTNTVAGHRFFADWYHEGMTEVRADLMRGVPIDQLARRHQPFLVHWWRPSELELRMRMLQDAGIGPFAERVSPAADGR